MRPALRRFNRGLLRLTTRGVTHFLIAYEFLFIGCSLYKLAWEGGRGLLRFWAHLVMEGMTSGSATDRPNWGQFAFEQLVLLFLTITSWKWARALERRRDA